MRELKRFFSYMGKYQWRYWLILITTLIMESFLQILYSFVTKQTLNAVEFQDLVLFRNAVIVCALIVVCKCLFPYLRYLQIRLVRKIVYELKLQLFAKLLHMNMTYFGRTHSAEAIKTLNWDANSLKDSWFSHVYWVLGKIVLVVSSVLTMYLYSPVLTGISLLISAITATVSVLINKSIKKSAGRVQLQSAKLSALLSDMITGFVTLKMNPGAGIVMGHFQEENKESFLQEKDRVHMSAVLEMVTFLLGILGSFGTITAGFLLVSAGNMDYGTVMAVVTLQMGVSSSMQRFGSSLSAFSTSLVRAGHVFDFMELQEEERKDEHDIGQNKDDCCFMNHREDQGGHKDQEDQKYQEKMPFAISITDLSFSYEAQEQVNLECKKMQIGHNEKILLAGESGCGKSTLLKLLQGFYPIEQGKISLYGKAIHEYSLEQLREMITYVPQESYLFQGTIAENIGFGWDKENQRKNTLYSHGQNVKVDLDRAAIIQAAKLANADEFIRILPDGYDTELSAGGMNLSGGQRQRIAIARALLKEAPIVLLDEPSSALDAHSEKLILQAMDALMNQKTVIMVTHRITNAEKFDRVIRL